MSIDRRSFLFGASGMAALTLAGCGGVRQQTSPTASSGAGSVTTQGFGKPDDVGQARIDAFKKAHPNIAVRVNEGDFDPQQFLSSVASGTRPTWSTWSAA